MKVHLKHGKVTQIMHGASRNYRYVWDVSSLHIVHDVEVSFNTTLHHLLELEDFMLHLLQPLLGAPLLDGPLQIFFVEDAILHPRSLGVLPHLSEVRVDDVDDDLSLGELGE